MQVPREGTHALGRPGAIPYRFGHCRVATRPDNALFQSETKDPRRPFRSGPSALRARAAASREVAREGSENLWGSAATYEEALKEGHSQVRTHRAVRTQSF